MWNTLRKIYVRIFSSSLLFQKINNGLLDLVISARGYNNHRNFIESGEKFFLKKYLSNKPNSLCIDVGASEGTYTHLLLKETKSKVISFEPFPFSYKKMVKNLSYFSDRCKFVNKGVGAKCETKKIYYNEENSDHASFAPEIKKVDYVKNNKSLDVVITSLDDFCKLNNIFEIDLIKIDTEGFEKEVFDGAKETFSKLKPKFIQVEYNWHHLFRNTSLYFFSEKLPNYNVYQLIYNNMRKIDPKHPYANLYMFSNFVFIRKDIDE